MSERRKINLSSLCLNENCFTSAVKLRNPLPRKYSWRISCRSSKKMRMDLDYSDVIDRPLRDCGQLALGKYNPTHFDISNDWSKLPHIKGTWDKVGPSSINSKYNPRFSKLCRQLPEEPKGPNTFKRAKYTRFHMHNIISFTLSQELLGPLYLNTNGTQYIFRFLYSKL